MTSVLKKLRNKHRIKLQKCQETIDQLDLELKQCKHKLQKPISSFRDELEKEFENSYKSSYENLLENYI